MKIKVKLFGNTPKLTIYKQGNWIDLRNRETIIIEAPIADTLRRNRLKEEDTRRRVVYFNFAIIPLGVAMQLPKGYEAVILLRSSTFKNYHLLSANSQGIIDNSYCGDTDEWKFPVIGFSDAIIEEGTRLCQFRIQLSQEATILQKIKWLFTSKIKFEYEEHLQNDSRGGFGSTGVK